MVVEFNNDHDKPEDSQLILALTGSPKAILEKLEQIVKECRNDYGKPVQGQVWSAYLQSQVITPVWKGKKY